MVAVDLDDPALVASHDADTFAENPNYPAELQPRDRSSEGMRADLLDKSGTRFDPHSLLREHFNLEQGLPIVSERGGQMVVESGNGRVMLLKRTLEDNYTPYRQAMSQYAEQYGINPEQLSQMNRPVLLRVRKTDLSNQQLEDFVDVANTSAATRYSAIETAGADAERITPEMMMDWTFDSHHLNLDELIQKKVRQGRFSTFIDSLPTGERAALRGRDGGLTEEGVDRVRNAMFAKAFPESSQRIVERVLTDPSPNLRSLKTGLVKAMPKMMAVSARIAEGSLSPNLDIAPALGRAVDRAVAIREANPDGNLRNMIMDELAQAKAFGEASDLEEDLLLNVIAENVTGRRTNLSEMLDTYLTRAMDSPDVRTPTFGGMAYEPDRVNWLTDVIREHPHLGPRIDIEQRQAGSGWLQGIQEANQPTQQANLGDEFATNENLDMPLGQGQAQIDPLVDPEQLAAEQARRDALAAGQEDMFGDASTPQRQPETPDELERAISSEVDADEILSRLGQRELHPEAITPVGGGMGSLPLNPTSPDTFLVSRLKQAKEIAKRLVRFGKMGKSQNLPPVTSRGQPPFENLIELTSPRVDETTREQLMRLDNGAANEGELQVNQMWNDMQPFYRNVGMEPNQFSENDLYHVLSVLHGEGDRQIASLPPELQRYTQRIRDYTQQMEAEELAFWTMADEEGWETFLNTSPREMIDRMEATKAKTGFYFPRFWADIDDGEAVTRPIGTGGGRPGHTFGRTDKTFNEIWGEGRRPLYNDPFLMLIHSQMQRHAYHRKAVFLNQAIEHGLARKASDLNLQDQRQWRVPDVGRPFMADSRMDSWAVDNRMADYLENLSGRRPHLPVYIPKLGERDVFTGLAKTANTFKMSKFLLSFFQPYDLMSRMVLKMGGSEVMRPFDLGYDAVRGIRGMERPPQRPWAMARVPRAIKNIFSMYLTGNDARSMRAVAEALSDDPVYIHNGVPITHRMYVREGLGIGGDRSVFLNTAQQGMVEGIDNFIANMERKPGARHAVAVKDWLQNGLFQAFYQQAMFELMDSFYVPHFIRKYPNLSAEQIVAHSADKANRFMSAHQPWQQWMFSNPEWSRWLQLGLTSTSEPRAWFGETMRAFPASGNRDWETHAAFWGSMMIAYGAVTEIMSAVSQDHQNFDPDTYIPIKIDPEIPFVPDALAGNEAAYAPLRVAYSKDFLRSPIPGLLGRGGRALTLDLPAQADTALRFLDPQAFISSRINIPWRAIKNQYDGKTWTGDPVDSWQKRLIQGAADILPIGVEGTVQAFRDSEMGRESGIREWVPETEGRIGGTGRALETIFGVNITAENNTGYRNRMSRDLGLLDEYGENEPYQKQIVNREIERVSGGELKLSAETGATRGQEWSVYTKTINDLRDEEQTRYNDLVRMSRSGVPVGQIVRQYFDIEREYANRRDQVRSDFGVEFDQESDSPMDSLMNEYYGLVEQAQTPGGNFDYLTYIQIREQFINSLSPDQREYILRNTNLTPIPDGLMDILERGAGGEARRITESQNARNQHLRRLGLHQLLDK